MIIYVNKKRLAAIILIVALVVCAALLYKPYLRKFEYPVKYSEIVTSCAEKYGVDPYLIYSVMKAESKFDESARSNKDAQGLMQITPETAEWAMEKMGISGDIFSPEINISVGSWYLAKMIKDHDGNYTAALAAYNAGSRNVNGWKDSLENLTLDDIQFEETYNYVYKTLEYYENYKKLYAEG
ncbi:MAG: lytic transglycosylase domain-containing protein [Monoglobales bacterium]